MAAIQAQWRAGAGTAQGEATLDAELEPLAVAPGLGRLQPAAGLGGNLTLAGHENLAHENVFNFFRFYTSSCKSFSNGEASEFGSREARECTAELSNRGTCSGDNV